MRTTYINTTARFTGLTIALALFAIAAQAQYKPTGDDGITASPKLRQFLDERRGAPATPPAPSDYKPMSCPKCKDEYSRRVDWSARGAHKPTVLVAKHLCDGCDTTIATVGRGKQARDVATHKCTSCGAESLACCNTKKGSETATKGMEKKFEVAPLK